MSIVESLSPAVWELMQIAKSVALDDGSAEILPRHLFQAFSVGSQALLEQTLGAMNLAGDTVRQYIGGLQPKDERPDPSAAKRPLSSEANAILEQAQRLAGDHPDPAAGTQIAPVHLWVSLCRAEATLRNWLSERNWHDEHVRRLPEVASKQLPPKQTSRPAALGEQAANILRQFCPRNLTELATQGRITPAFAIGDLRQQLTNCLLRKQKRSVVLTGAAGVGKTKLVEDLAVGISNGQIPELAGCQVFELDLTQFTRGTHYAGSRAERWAQLTEVLRAHSESVILFIDELHTVVGLPLEGQAMDLANVLKPLMVDDRVRLIGATTSEEYRRHIEGDPALARRFTEVKVPEPDRETMLQILAKAAPEYEQFHGVEFSRESLETIYEVADAYVPNQSFPAKAIDLLDEVGVQARTQARDGGAQERPVVGAGDVWQTLKRIRGVDADSASVDIAGLLKEAVIGQDLAADTLADVIVHASFRYGKDQRGGPRAVVLFVGPPGVGKSYMARVLSEVLFPGRDTMLVLDMTEFSGPHTGEHARFRLLGPPPPYVGWENGGLLTSHVQQNPISVVLIDEFEKAQPEARNILLRAFNDGWVQDGRGRIVSFRGTYFVLTANAGRSLWEDRDAGGWLPVPHAGGETEPRQSADERIREALLRDGFSPELLSRISYIVLFNELGKQHLQEIARLKLAQLQEIVLVEDGVLLDFDGPALTRWLVDQVAPPRDSRRLQVAFESCVETPLARWRLQTPRGQTAILRIAPGERVVAVEALSKQGASAESLQLLFDRVAELFSQRKKKQQQQQSARLRFGTGP